MNNIITPPKSQSFSSEISNYINEEALKIRNKFEKQARLDVRGVTFLGQDNLTESLTKLGYYLFSKSGKRTVNRDYRVENMDGELQILEDNLAFERARAEVIAKLPEKPLSVGLTYLSIEDRDASIKQNAKWLAKNPPWEHIDELKIPGENKAERMVCEKFWTKRLRKDFRQWREMVWLSIRPHFIKSISDDATNEIRSMDRANDEWAQENPLIHKETGEKFFIPSLEKRMKIQRAETYTRIKAIFEEGEENGLSPFFCTITLPSRFHATTTAGGNTRRPNPRYDGSSPREAHEWVMSRIQKFQRNIHGSHSSKHYEVQAVYVAEPHQDETPHYHLVLQFHAKNFNKINSLLNKYFLEDNEKHNKHRIDLKPISDPKGEKAGVNNVLAYVSGYLFAHHSTSTETAKREQKTGKKNKKNSDKYRAWRRTWNIRAFNFFSTLIKQKITTYRKIKRKKETHETVDIWFGEGFAESLDFKSWLKINGDFKNEYSSSENKYKEPTKKLTGIDVFGILVKFSASVWLQKIKPKTKTPTYLDITKWEDDDDGFFSFIFNKVYEKVDELVPN